MSAHIRRSEARKAFWAHPENRARISAAIKAGMADPEVRARMIEERRTRESKPRCSDQQLETIERMRERGRSYRAIGAATGLSENTVAGLCLAMAIEGPRIPKVPIRPEVYLRGTSVIRSFTAAEDSSLIEMVEADMPLNDIARALGRYTSSVRNRLRTLARREERAEDACPSGQAALVGSSAQRIRRESAPSAAAST